MCRQTMYIAALPMNNSAQDKYSNSLTGKVMLGLYCPSAKAFADPVLLFDKYVD
jgi:hypothetical protein